MKSTFRRFALAGLPSLKTPKVTIQKGGTISFNGVAYAALHQPRLVRPSFDEQTQVITIEAARVEDEYTIPVRTEGKGTTHVFAGRTSMQNLGIDTSTARQYEAGVEQGKLFMDLRQEPKLVGKRKKAAGTADRPAGTLPEEQPPETEQSVEASESDALLPEPPSPYSPAAPNLEGLMEALLPVVEW
jgi:hypothetical protein